MSKVWLPKRGSRLLPRSPHLLPHIKPATQQTLSIAIQKWLRPMPRWLR